MTRDEQTTERALQNAAADWLRARGWSEIGNRWQHSASPQAEQARSLHEAMVVTRFQPLLYRKSR